MLSLNVGFDPAPFTPDREWVKSAKEEVSQLDRLIADSFTLQGDRQPSQASPTPEKSGGPPPRPVSDRARTKGRRTVAANVDAETTASRRRSRAVRPYGQRWASSGSQETETSKMEVKSSLQGDLILQIKGDEAELKDTILAVLQSNKSKVIVLLQVFSVSP